MKKLLTLCTKNVHFSFNNEIYIQIEGAGIGLPLGLVIANIFMVKLKTTLVPKLDGQVQKWRGLVDDTFMYVKTGSVKYVLSVLISFHKKIKLIYEEEHSNTLPLLDVLSIGDSGKLNTTVYRKNTLELVYTNQLEKRNIEIVN